MDLEGNGARVYFGMFESSPAIKVMFPFTHDEQFRRLGLQDPRLRNHAATVMVAVGSVITGMNEDLKATKATLKALGASHGHLGVKPDMMDHLGASMINVMSELVGDDKWTPELEVAWEKVLQEARRAAWRAPPLLSQPPVVGRATGFDPRGKAVHGVR